MAQKLEAQGGKEATNGTMDPNTMLPIARSANALGLCVLKKFWPEFKFYLALALRRVGPGLHGIKGRSIAADPFVINHPEEHQASVEGWYGPGGLIQGLKFISNKKTSDFIGYDDGSHFTLQVQDKKIIGFHGFAETMYILLELTLLH
ncbi:unnamed protein product [Arabis nemorensis]|uniref:Jacalin-type lectin domain-containing protein n=1 Tax=Arabis nemorensis TaxID=586526 RepID=A0A565BAC8_9BRAS|nr:unnamed protein product [Arabis nemorensis]